MAVLAQEQNPEEGEGLTILEHLQELRKRLMICAGGVVIGLIIGAVFATRTMRWMKGPGESRVADFQLVFTDPLEYWSTFFRVMMLIAITIAMPIIVWQIMAFVGPGLTRNEKKWAYPIVLGASLMFVAGCAFAFYVELPPALNFLLDGGDVAKPLISVQKYIDFVTKMMLINGLVFETPFVVMGFAKVGFVTSKKLLGWWRFAFVGAFIVAAIVTPSIDPITQTLVALPMVVLYFGGIVLAKLVEKTPIIPRY
ncbi:MAG TPA: twin-arginine translocase subunit TatC [Dehalococcoidia bacterium]|nr:twin-arginine translocase subunit TatC [Dehalococcoidia bacterium]